MDAIEVIVSRGMEASVSGQSFVFAYRPNVWANSISLSWFVVCLVAQIVFGLRYKSRFFMVSVSCCLVLESLGYIGRILMNLYPLNRTWFLMSACCLTMGPAFLAAGIYYNLSQIVALHGRSSARLSPRSYTIIFICCDITNLVLQGGGGGIASATNNIKITNIGINVVVAGLVAQVVSLLAFIFLSSSFAIRIWKHEELSSEEARTFRRTREWKMLVGGLGAATFCIFTRSCFRIAELSQGYSGPIATNQALFMVFECAMIMLAVLSVTICHPGRCFSGAALPTPSIWSDKESSCSSTETITVTTKDAQ